MTSQPKQTTDECADYLRFDEGDNFTQCQWCESLYDNPEDEEGFRFIYCPSCREDINDNYPIVTTPI